MKADELMIGDWLQHTSGKYFQVTRIDMWSDGSVHFTCGHPNLWEYNNEFSSIPITPEILEKNGFVKGDEISDTPPFDRDEEGNMYYSYKGEHKFWGWWQPDNIYFIPTNAMGNIEIKFVHELQHALRLCGIEKEIEL